MQGFENKIFVKKSAHTIGRTKMDPNFLVGQLHGIKAQQEKLTLGKLK